MLPWHPKDKNDINDYDYCSTTKHARNEFCQFGSQDRAIERKANAHKRSEGIQIEPQEFHTTKLGTSLTEEEEDDLVSF